MTNDQKIWIDNASYEQLLRKWRFAPIGDPMFQGKTGDYYSEVMKLKREQITDKEHTKTSKRIGWE